ncbi:MAG: phosphatidate cytidylyltransferase [Dehalococcoidia bacterium]|nr:phosphatidate cytidylyltransferase [Dehalococcoidia bacterium]
MLLKRVTTSVLLVPVVWAAVWFPQTPIPWFAVFMAIWALGALYEFYRIICAAGKCRPLTYPGLALAFLLIVQPLIDLPDSSRLVLALAVVIPLVWLMFQRDKDAAFANWAWTLAGIMYLGWLVSPYIALRGLDYGREWVIFALFTTFVSDSTAYFVGRALGRHRLAPIISPRKTWEGAAGGVMGAMLASFILQSWLKLPVSYIGLAALAAVVSVFGQIGDLVESLFKRNTNAKDSSRALPGHGGFLDRIDSIIFAGLTVYFYVALSQGG